MALDRAAGAVGVGVINALAVEPGGAAIGQHQQVVGIVQVMPALAQHIAAKFLANLFRGVFHIGGRLNAVAAQDLRFGDVGVMTSARGKAQFPAR